MIIIVYQFRLLEFYLDLVGTFNTKFIYALYTLGKGRFAIRHDFKLL